MGAADAERGAFCNYLIKSSLLTMRHPVSIVVFWLTLVPQPAFAQSPPAVSQAQRIFLQKLVDAAVERTHHSVRYDPA